MLTRTQKLQYRVKSGYFATQLKPAAVRFFLPWTWGQYGKRFGGCGYQLFTLLAFSTRVIGMSR